VRVEHVVCQNSVRLRFQQDMGFHPQADRIVAKHSGNYRALFAVSMTPKFRAAIEAQRYFPGAGLLGCTLNRTGSMKILSPT
jgi:hypothetical protein